MSETAAYPPTVALRMEAARRLGCEVEVLDVETGYLYEVRRHGRRRVLLGAYSPLNDAGAARLATDKFHAGTVLARAGIPVPDTARCLQPGRYDDASFRRQQGLGPARRFARDHGFPLIVKPNQGARGRDVVAVAAKHELEAAIEQVWRWDYLALVQIAAPGIDVRIDCLDGEYLFGYVRRPVRLIGDGRRTLGALLVACNARFADPRFRARLATDSLLERPDGRRRDLDDVVASGEEIVFETPVMNLNRLCLADRLHEPPRAWLEQALVVGRTLGLRHFGVDFKTASLENEPRTAVVVDVNASPSLVQMAAMGHHDAVIEAEMKVVAAALERPSPTREQPVP